MVEDHLYPNRDNAVVRNDDNWAYQVKRTGDMIYIPIPGKYAAVAAMLKSGNPYVSKYMNDDLKSFQNYLDTYADLWYNQHFGDFYQNDPVKTASNLATVAGAGVSTGAGSGGAGVPTSVIPSSNSGAGVEDDSFDFSIYGDYEEYLKAIKEMSDYQSAKEREAAEAQNAWQRETNQIAMDYNAAEAAKNRDWQEYMSNTAHQREVQDLIAAGLNPVLSASGGNGAAVTSGATASGVTSPGTKANVDNTFVLSLLSFLNNIMGYATSTAAAGISAGGVIGAANIAAESAKNNTNTQWGLIRRVLDIFSGDRFR